MTTGTSFVFETVTWSVLYLGSCVLFFGIATWVIVRGGRDILDILTEAFRNIGDQKTNG